MAVKGFIMTDIEKLLVDLTSYLGSLSSKKKVSNQELELAIKINSLIEWIDNPNNNLTGNYIN